MKIIELKRPLAITMWDSSWLRRRYAGGGFESFDRALDELKERGYNAVRIDAFPHMIADAPDGSNAESFLDVPGVSWHKYGFAQWGNQWTVYIHPRRDIVEFIKKAEQRGICVALSTWLKPTWEHRNDYLEGPESLIRIWDETLCYLRENGCIDNIVYVDVHNEIPWGACNTWLYNRLAYSGRTEEGKKRQKAFYRNYFNSVLHELKARWPMLSFTASLTQDVFSAEMAEADLSEFDLLDVHFWAEYAPVDFLKDTGYREHITSFGNPGRMYLDDGGLGYNGAGRRVPGDFYFEKTNEKIHEAWTRSRGACEEWLESMIESVASAGRKYGIPVGNTEGWGSVIWLEHPMLQWDFIKDAGMIAAKLAARHGYAFTCQSNFCEPQYLRLWRDTEYHRQITDVIRNGNITY